MHTLCLNPTAHMLWRGERRVSRGSSVSIVSGYGLGDRAIEVRSRHRRKDFLLTSVSRPAVGPIQLPFRCVQEVLSPEVKRGYGGQEITQLSELSFQHS
jgi:hypothetical protein